MKEVFDKLVDDMYQELINISTKEGHHPSEYLSHHGAGTGMRNSLKLWWQPDWSEAKPPIVEFFNSKNIFHADDMSGTIQAAIEAKINNKVFEIDEHLQRYFEHWKNEGFKDGIFKN